MFVRELQEQLLARKPGPQLRIAGDSAAVCRLVVTCGKEAIEGTPDGLTFMGVPIIITSASWLTPAHLHLVEILATIDTGGS